MTWCDRCGKTMGKYWVGFVCDECKVIVEKEKEQEKSTDSKNMTSEQEEMKEEQHELDLKENYEADEKYEESKD